MPPASALPSSIAGLQKRSAIELSDLEPTSPGIEKLLSAVNQFVPYSRARKQAPKKDFRPLTADELRSALSSDLTQWRCVANTLSPSANKPRRELQRDFRFSSFQEALRFISEIAPQCELLSHHPRLENQWRDVRVGLTTWRNDYDVSNLDLALARQIEVLYGRQYGANAA
jgi:pterin-4a-carbinolamine dehydratase